MSNLRIDFYNHKGNWKISQELKDQIIKMLNDSKGELNSCDVYFMKNSTTQYETSDKKQLNIFFGASPGETAVENYFLTTEKGTYAIEAMMYKSTYYATPLVDEKQQVIGFYSERYNEFYVPFNIDELDAEIVDDILIYVLTKFKELILDEFVNKDSWLKSKQKDALHQRVVEHLSKGKESRVRDLKMNITDAESNIERRTRELKERYDSLIHYRKQLEEAETMGITGLDNFIKGLDQVANHPQVSNILVVNDLITIYIDNVYAYATVRGVERRYYIGNMHVKININNTDIKFFGDNPRRSVWTSRDPHPHVNGSDGRACLGNVSATIAQLCSQKEIYPLFLVCLDFLENANTEDSAGKNVKNWDEVDEEGNKVKKEEEFTICCEHCDEDIEEGEDSYTVFTDFNDSNGELLNPETWCESCRDEYASFVEGFEETVSDDIYSDVSDWQDDDEEEDSF